MATRVVSFGAHTFDPVTDGFEVGLGPGPQVGIEASLTSRAGVRPRLDAIAPATRTLEVHAWKTDPLLSIEEFRRRLGKIFDPERGEQELVAQRVDGAQVRLLAYPVRISLRGEGESDARVTLESRDLAWQAVTESSSSGPTLTIGGNVAARPRIVIPGSSGAACQRTRVIWTDRTGRGVGGYPVCQPWSHPAQNTVVFQNGLAIPFQVVSGKLWYRVDIPPNGSTVVDIYHGGGVTNTVTADALDDGGLDLADSDNTTWRWYAIRAGRNPLAAAGAWRFGRTYNHAQQRDYTFGVHEDADDRAALELVDRQVYDDPAYSYANEPPGGQYPDDFDSLVLVTGVEATSISVPVELRSHWFVLSRSEVLIGIGRLALVYRRPNSPNWEVAATQSIAGEIRVYKLSNYPDPPYYYLQYGMPKVRSLTWTRSLPGVVSIALQMRPYSPEKILTREYRVAELDDDERLPGTGYISIREEARYTTVGLYRGNWGYAIATLPITVTLDSSRVPVMTTVETVPARVLDGTILAGDQWIELEQVFVDQVDLTIDCDGRRVAVASGPFYARDLRFADGARWIELHPGPNSVSAPWPVVWAWRDRWLV